MKNKEKNFISAVVYVRNVEKAIKNFILNLNKVLDKNFLKYEIILVNDGSTDKSVEVIKNLAEKIDNASISIINMSHYQGKELAMNAGLDLSIGDFVYEFDTITIDYDVNTIFDAYKKSLEGYDIVNVSSNSKRRISSAFFYKVFNKYSNYQYKLDTETFRILSRRAINRVNTINKTVPYRKAVLANCGLKLATITYKSNANVKVQFDKDTIREREQNAFDALILFTNISYKIAMWLIMILIIVTLSISTYAIYTFVTNSPIAGWTSTMLVLSFGFLGMFTILAIMIKYLSVIVSLIFKKTNYLVESIEKIN